MTFKVISIQFHCEGWRIPNSTVAPLPPPKQVRLNLIAPNWFDTPVAVKVKFWRRLIHSDCSFAFHRWTQNNSKPRFTTVHTVDWEHCKLIVTRATLHHKLASDIFTFIVHIISRYHKGMCQRMLGAKSSPSNLPNSWTRSTKTLHTQLLRWDEIGTVNTLVPGGAIEPQLSGGSPPSAS